MNPYRPDRRGDAVETERLLDATRAAQPVGTGAESAEVRTTVPAADPVARLLAAAAGPARPGELTGEEAALAGFRATRVTPASTAPGRPHRRRMTTGVMAWIGALAATATAGGAFAAVGLDRAPELPPAPAHTSPSSTPTRVDESPSGDRTAAPSRSAPPQPPSASSTPSATGTPPTGASPAGTPSTGTAPAGKLHGQCRAWLAKNPRQREKALRTPGFQDLVTAAGGADEVEAYCRRLVPDAVPTTSPKVTPSPTGGPAALG
ncbi:hypothetical protein [Micromonospora sp. 067-2]|uniref:hypothetical protein n=1 Tax=Micromonospora sp. 067-2 TaxID=2789270 RepID=UPI00397ACDB6